MEKYSENLMTEVLSTDKDRCLPEISYSAIFAFYFTVYYS